MPPGRYMASSAMNNLTCVIKYLPKHHDKIHTAYSQQSAIDISWGISHK